VLGVLSQGLKERPGLGLGSLGGNTPFLGYAFKRQRTGGDFLVYPSVGSHINRVVHRYPAGKDILRLSLLGTVTCPVAGSMGIRREEEHPALHGYGNQPPYR